MAFFGDLLKGVNARLGYNADDPERDDPAVNQKLAFSSKPRSHIVSLGHFALFAALTKFLISRVIPCCAFVEPRHGEEGRVDRKQG